MLDLVSTIKRRLFPYGADAMISQCFFFRICFAVEYIFIAQHRENWANIGALKDSLADESHFALEIAKKMDMRYQAPPMPVNLKMIGSGGGLASNTPDLHQQMAAQIMSQSDRLSQPVLPSGSSGSQIPSSRPLSATHSPGKASQDYSFADIEAMFNKNK